jgi:hypothetical protein
MFYIDQQETSFLKQNKSCLFHLNRNINAPNGSRAATKSSPFITTKAKSPSNLLQSHNRILRTDEQLLRV